MKYVIDEEELIGCLYHRVDVIAVKGLLKDKQSIEEIFEGSYLLEEPEGTFENPEFWEAMENISESDIKKFKIFIQKETP